MKKATTLVAIILAAISLSDCDQEPISPTDSSLFTCYFKYGQLFSILEDPDGQSETYRGAARFYCFTENDHKMILYSSLDMDTTYLEPVTMTDQVLRWSIEPYQGPQEHYQGDLVIQVWFPDTVTRANFDFTFRLRLRHP